MSDYMKEMERLVSDLIDAAHGTVMTEDQEREDTARAALLAHAAQAEPECTCKASDMPFGRCCKVTPNAQVVRRGAAGGASERTEG